MSEKTPSKPVPAYPVCPELGHFEEWFNEKVFPEFKKLYAHILTCSRCQQAFLEFKGQMELKMIQTSDAEFIEEMKKL